MTFFKAFCRFLARGHNTIRQKKGLVPPAFVLPEHLLFRLDLTAPGNLCKTSGLELDTARRPIDGKPPEGSDIARAHLGAALDSSKRKGPECGSRRGPVDADTEVGHFVESQPSGDNEEGDAIAHPPPFNDIVQIQLKLARAIFSFRDTQAMDMAVMPGHRLEICRGPRTLVDHCRVWRNIGITVFSQTVP